MEITKKSIKIISEIAGIPEEKINISDSLANDLGIDSLGLVELMLNTEENFDIKFEESDLNPHDLGTVNDLIDLVNRYLREKKE